MKGHKAVLGMRSRRTLAKVENLFEEKIFKTYEEVERYIDS